MYIVKETFLHLTNRVVFGLRGIEKRSHNYYQYYKKRFLISNLQTFSWLCYHTDKIKTKTKSRCLQITSKIFVYLNRKLVIDVNYLCCLIHSENKQSYNIFNFTLLTFMKVRSRHIKSHDPDDATFCFCKNRYYSELHKSCW